MVKCPSLIVGSGRTHNTALSLRVVALQGSNIVFHEIFVNIGTVFCHHFTVNTWLYAFSHYPSSRSNHNFRAINGLMHLYGWKGPATAVASIEYRE